MLTCGSRLLAPRRSSGLWLFLLALLALVAASAPATAQTLTPRAYWPAPTGTKLIAIGFAYQEGDVATDPSLPVEDLDAKVASLQAGFVYFFDLAGRTASFTLEAPWTEASLEALFLGEERSRDLSGFADVKARVAVNLLGAPAMSPAEFRNFLASPEPVLGVSLKIQAPTGEYDSDRLVNLGSNRWSVRPEVGYLHPLGRDWILEIAAGAWIYDDNNDFVGRTREQEPLVGAELHLVRPVRRTNPNFWVSLDLNFFAGGRTKVNGVRSDDQQRNSRIGATIVIPFSPGHALKLAGTTALVTERGGDFDALILAYQRAWR